MRGVATGFGITIVTSGTVLICARGYGCEKRTRERAGRFAVRAESESLMQLISLCAPAQARRLEGEAEIRATMMMHVNGVIVSEACQIPVA